uniref:Uncharacterized protein n=1 Tax=Octopus bimaculoides TaxID=37653 RepID=A0A0L8H677_OCTBM
MASARKIKKVDKENCRFNEAWTNLYFFVESNTKCLCLIYGETVAVPKVENVKRHYTLKHALTHNHYEKDQRLKTLPKIHLNELCKNLEAYNIAIDESTDITDTLRLAIFVRGVDTSLNITEVLLVLCPMKENCTGAAVFKEINTALEKAGLTYNRLESLCSKITKFDHVMDNIVKAANFIRSRALNYRQFRNFLDETDSEFAGIPYFTEIRWLSRDRTLKRFYDIREHVAAFFEAKGNSCINYFL